MPEPRVTGAHIEAAEAILARIAFSAGEDVEPEETLGVWRIAEGIEEGALEAAADASARGTMAEIEQLIQDGAALTPQDLFAYIEREYLHAFQLGWIVRARADVRRQAERAQKEQV